MFPDSTIDSALMATFPEDTFVNDSSSNQCLVLEMGVNTSSYLKAVSCLEQQPSFVCEIRVQGPML